MKVRCTYCLCNYDKQDLYKHYKCINKCCLFICDICLDEFVIKNSNIRRYTLCTNNSCIQNVKAMIPVDSHNNFGLVKSTYFLFLLIPGSSYLLYLFISASKHSLNLLCYKFLQAYFASNIVNITYDTDPINSSEYEYIEIIHQLPSIIYIIMILPIVYFLSMWLYILHTLQMKIHNYERRNLFRQRLPNDIEGFHLIIWIRNYTMLYTIDAQNLYVVDIIDACDMEISGRNMKMQYIKAE